jgi:hypothetical protein
MTTESRTLFVLMNHALNEQQMDDAKASLGISNFEYAPENVLNAWGYIPPHLSMWELKDFLKPVFSWLKDSLKPNDILLVQGESIATYVVVDAVRAAFPLDNIRCVAATSERVTEEVTLADGSIKKTAVFKHIRYRAYYA